MRIVLGTAQFGLEYGVSNKFGRTSLEEIDRILDFCTKNDIEEIDTAWGYGIALDALGEFDLSKFRITSKIPSLKNSTNIDEDISEYIERTYERLNINSLENLLLHDECDYYQNSEIIEILKKKKKEYNISEIGVSVYGIKRKLVLDDDCTVVQIPGNFFDRRFDTLRKKNVYIRSVFLQGLLLMEKRPEFFDIWQNEFELYEQYSEKFPNKLSACINVINAIRPDSKGVVGVTTLQELKEINMYKNICIDRVIPDIYIENEDLINPSRWPK